MDNLTLAVTGTVVVATGAVVILVLVWIIATYNKLVTLRNRVKNQWAQVDVHLKRRFDLIPNLVESVKGYAKHEKATLEAVITARNNAVSAKTPKDEITANNQLTGMLNKLFALSEAYPELKANASFLQLQKSLKDTEDKIAYARQFYNDSVLIYQNKTEAFPTVIIAGIFGFKAEDYFVVAESERMNVEVKF